MHSGVTVVQPPPHGREMGRGEAHSRLSDRRLTDKRNTRKGSGEGVGWRMTPLKLLVAWTCAAVATTSWRPTPLHELRFSSAEHTRYGSRAAESERRGGRFHSFWRSLWGPHIQALCYFSYVHTRMGATLGALRRTCFAKI